MTPQQAGTIAARSIGILLCVVGLVILIDHYFTLYQSRQLIEETGWNSNFVAEEGDGAGDSFVKHDTYIGAMTVYSSLSGYLFSAIGIIFILASRTIGKWIAGKEKE